MALAVLAGVPWAPMGALPLGVALTSRTHAQAVPRDLANAPAGPADVTRVPTTQRLEITQSAAGPWGTMQLVPIVLAMPDEYADAEFSAKLYDAWHFANLDRDAALTQLAALGLSGDQLAAIGEANWSQLDGGTARVVPPDALLLQLSPDVRGAIYAWLARDPKNRAVIEPHWFRVDRVDFRLRGSGLAEPSVALLKRLLYRGATDDILLFADVKPALRALTDPAERMRFLKATTRKRTFIARLEVDASADVAELARYWGVGGREAALTPLLESMKVNAIAGVERPGRLNISALLPPFAQERLYRHAEPLPARTLREDCYWTAFNFFSTDATDDRVQDMAYLAGLLEREYQRIDAPSRLGDVVLLADAQGNVVHAANYIADDLIFTKNGISSRQPWILVPMRDMLATYQIGQPTLTVAYFRRR